MQRFDTVIVSDLHLGARNARCQDFLDFLAWLETDRLIVNGDLFQDPKLRLLRECDVEVVESLRHLAQFTRVDWLLGNHDPPERWLSALLGIEGQDELVLDVDGGDTWSATVIYGTDRWAGRPGWSAAPRRSITPANGLTGRIDWPGFLSTRANGSAGP